MFSKEEKKKLTIQFWDAFSLYCSRMGFLRGRGKTWILHRTKVSNVHLKFDLSNSNVKVVLELEHRNEEKRLEMFEKLEMYQSLLEDGFVNGLIWDFAYLREKGNEVCRIYTQLDNANIYNISQWEDIFSFMAENMYLLEKNFLEIRDLIND